MARRATPAHEPSPASLAEFARRAGVNRSSVSRLAAGKLRVALQPDGRIDAAHPAVAAWARKKGIKPSVLIDTRHGAPDRAPTPPPESPPPAPAAPTKARKPRRSEESEPTEPLPEVPDPDRITAANIESASDDLTLRQVVARWGNLRRFNDELDALKKIEEIRQKYLSNEETEGRLISRELVKAHVFGALDALSRKLLRDSTKTIARRVYGLVKTDAGLEQVEALVREILTSQIRPTKAQIVKVLRNA